MHNGHIFELELKGLKKLMKKISKYKFYFLFPNAPIVLKNQKDDEEIFSFWINELGEKNHNKDCFYFFSRIRLNNKFINFMVI